MQVITPGKDGKAFSFQSYPALGCSDEEALAYAKKVLSDKSRLLRHNLLRMGRNLMAYNGRFVSMDPKLMADTAGGYRWKDMEWSGRLPEPDNRIALGVDNTVSRLTRNEYEPAVRAERHIPEWEAAARMSKGILVDDLEKQAWPDLRDALAFDLTLYGTACGAAIWDETATDISVVASPEASICPQCSTKYGSSIVPRDQARMGIPHPVSGMLMPIRGEVMRDAPRRPGRDPEVQLTHCPMCAQNGALGAAPPELKGYAPTEEEAEGETDPFGRPLGLAVPKGEGLFQVVNMFGLRPQNGGNGVEPNTCKVWGLKEVKELEWIASRYHEKAEEITQGQVGDMLKLDPTMGDAMFSEGASQQGVYDHHNVFGQVYIEPIDLPGLELGRRIITCGDKLLCNDELCTEVATPDGKTKKVYRARFAATRYNRVPNVFWGKTPVDHAIPLNRRLLRIDMQIEAMRERGMPWWALPVGTELNERTDNTGAYRFTEVELADGTWQNPKDWLVNANPGNGNAYMAERDRLITAIESHLGPAPVESGINQPSVKSGEHLQILVEEARQKRDKQERSLTGIHETMWTAHLEQTWAFRREQVEYEEERGTRFERKSFTGTDLLGQTRVKVEHQGAINQSVYQGKAVEAALQIPGLVDIQTDDAAREKALDLMGIPKLNEEYSIQVSGSEQAWSEFIGPERRIPALDATIHDPWIWFRVLGKHWQEDEAVELQRKVGWDGIRVKLDGWERTLQTEQALEAAARPVYEGQDPTKWQAIYKEGSAKALLAGQPFPPPPAGGTFLPDNLLDQIMLVWLPRLDGVLAPPEAMAAMPDMQRKPLEELEAVLQMYGVIQQCRLEAEKKKQSAMGGTAEIAAPGGGMSPSGLEPVPGQGVVPAPGGAPAMAGAA